MDNVLGSLVDFISHNWFFLIFIGFLLWMLRQRRKPETIYASKDEFDAQISAGIPVIVEFYNDT